MGGEKRVERIFIACAKVLSKICMCTHTHACTHRSKGFAQIQDYNFTQEREIELNHVN